MDEAVGAAAEVICVDLEVERKPLHSLLRGEVCAQRVNANVHLEEREEEGYTGYQTTVELELSRTVMLASSTFLSSNDLVASWVKCYS